MKIGKHALCMLPELCLAFTLAACGGTGEQSKAEAASMWLVRTEGAVAVTDDAGADVSLTDRLGLFSGYGVATQTASYGWIDLDETKLTKMDENSDVTVQKDGKDLTLTVNSGSLFFNVTEPLAEDETVEIRSANMVTAIRGTCGWVEVTDAEHMNVYILEGTVECSVGDVTESVTAGQCAALNVGEGTIAVEPFSASDIPAFVTAEVTEDEPLAAVIFDAFGLDVRSGGSPVALALARYRTIVGQAAAYDYGGSTPTGAYRYTLVQMEPDDTVPTLLVEQQVDEHLYRARLFQYDPASGTVIQPPDIFREGWSPTGESFTDGLVMQEDGHGLKVSKFASGILEERRATLNGNSFEMELQRSESLGEDIDGVAFPTLDWHDTGDLSALDSWMPNSAPALAVTEPVETESVPPEDGDRIVLAGTLNKYSYEETIALQGMPDPAAAWADTSQMYWIIVLDGPQTIEITSGGDPGLSARETSMVAVLEPGGLEGYAGQHITFSIDPQTSYWQSDASMPMGAARTTDVHVLG